MAGISACSAVLYRYTQVLQRPDLVNSKGKPLLSEARLEALYILVDVRQGRHCPSQLSSHLAYKVLLQAP
jgi:hypothetical protein